MATLVYGLNQSLDGYVNHDHPDFRPQPELFRHYIDQVRGQAGFVYGRGLYEVMRYWDEDRPAWNDDERAFAAAWRDQPKWVASASLGAVGPNATLIRGDVVAAVGRLKAERSGELGVGGTALARSLGEAGLIDAYRLYLLPVVLGRGTPYFAGPRPRLRLRAVERIVDDVVRLTYAPA